MAIVINGSGTITGISVGGLPDSIVDAGTLATNSVDSAELIDGSIDTAHIADSQITQAKMNANAVTTAVIADDAVTGAKISSLPTGSVLQVVNSTGQEYASTSSATYGDTGLSATITPSATSSKILVQYTSGLCYQTDNTNFYAIFTFVRGSTNIAGTANSGASGDYHYGATGWNDRGFTVAAQNLDSPSTTSATTYKVQFRVTGGTIYHDLEGESSLTLMEIAV